MSPGPEVNAAGTSIEGDLDVTGSDLTEADEDALVASRRHAGPMAEPGTSGINWELITQVVGLAAGLTAWVAVVGGARVWARLTAADAPATPALAGLGQGWLIAEGLQALLLPMLLGSVIGLLVYYSRSRTWLSEPTAGRPEASASRARERLLPLVALRRLDDRVRDRGWLVGLLLLGLLGAGLLAAQASVQVLLSTLLVVSLGATAGGLRLRGPLEPPAEGPPTRLPWAIAAILVVALAMNAIWWWQGGSPWWVALVAVAVGLALAGMIAWASRQAGRWSSLAEVLVGAVLIFGVLLAMLVTVELPWLLLMGFITIVIAWITLGALVDKTPRGAAITVFVAIVIWSGALGYVREIGDRSPDLLRAEAELRDGGPVGAYFLGRSGSHVFMAGDDPDGSGTRELVILAETDVARIVLIGSEGVGTETSDEPNWLPLDTHPDPGKTDDGDLEEDGEPDPATPEPQPTYEPEPLDPFNDPPALASLNEEVAGIPVRLELVGLGRRDDVVHLDLRVVNMDAESHSVATMLGLDGNELVSPVLIDTFAEKVYQVSTGEAGCDCSGGLDADLVDGYQSRRLWALYVVPDENSPLDVTVPGLGTFRNVVVE